ncbi:MAG: redoxin domain-containing protein [Polyangiaceae bacterium]
MVSAYQAERPVGNPERAPEGLDTATHVLRTLLKETPMTIQVGAEAPDFELPSSEQENGRPGKKIKLSDFRGKKSVILAFYPLDFSPVCSGEHACFVEDFSEVEKAGAQVLGISVDSVWAHQAFVKHLGLKYPLLADFQPRGAIASKYGLYLADKGITARATVIVDKQGKVAWVKEEEIPSPRDNKKILAELSRIK